MKLLVKYDNPQSGEHEDYTTTLADLVDSFNEMLDEKAFVKKLKESGTATIENGYATTTVKVVGK